MTDAEAKRCRHAMTDYFQSDGPRTEWWTTRTAGEAMRIDAIWKACWTAATAPRPAPEGTVRVPVVMDATGQYFAIRHSADTDRQAMSKCLEYAADDLGEIRHATWIVADVPSPPVEVRGEVEA